MYDYFANGKYPNVYLRDQDVILVKPYEAEIELLEGFKQLGLFEVKKNESVKDLLKLSGGVTSSAFKGKVFIERYDDFSKKMIEIVIWIFLFCKIWGCNLRWGSEFPLQGESISKKKYNPKFWVEIKFASLKI